MRARRVDCHFYGAGCWEDGFPGLRRVEDYLVGTIAFFVGLSAGVQSLIRMSGSSLTILEELEYKMLLIR